MTTKERARILKGAKEAFSLAMLAVINGYARYESRTNNGYTTIVVFSRGGYAVRGEWHTNPYSNKSSGSTLITFHETPIWQMCFGGECPEEFVVFLKNVLKKQYSKKRAKFTGCHGPECFRKGNLEYENEGDGNFSRFWGRESISQKIYTPDWEEVGYHEYSGMALI